MSIIYKITNLANGMVYIGRSNKTLEEAWTSHRYEGGQATPKRLIGQAIKHFGIDQFAYETIEECDATELRARHKHWMAHYSSDTKGYNKKHTGSSFVSHDNVMDMHAKGMSVTEIAQKLGCDERTVVSHIKRNGLNVIANNNNPRKPSTKDAVMQLWSIGLNHFDIAEHLHRKHSYVHTILRNNGVSLQELYERRGLPMPANCRRYDYTQVNAKEQPVEIPDCATTIAHKHDISTATLYDACTGPRTHAKGKMFRRLNEDGEVVPRLYEPVGHAVPTKAICATNPELIQNFPSITAAVVALVGTKDVYVMQQIREAATKGSVYQGMYWTVEKTDNKRRPIYAFSVTDYNVRHTFRNQTEAAITLHVHQNAVSRHLNYPKKYRSVGGFICTWNENLLKEEWEEVVKYVRPANGRCKGSQTKTQHIYLTDINVYNVTYCPTLLDAMAKTKSSVAVIHKCLRGEAKSTKQHFVTDHPITVDEWSVRVSQLNTLCKPVYGVHPVTNHIVTANSITEAAKKVTCANTTISKALRGKTRLAAGYQWYYGVPQTV